MSLKNLKKMFRKSPASNDRAAIFKNADFSRDFLKVSKLSKFQHFSHLKFSSVFIISSSTILFSKHRKIKRRKR